MVTDTQLYLAIGVPTFAVLIGLLMNVIHHNAVNSRFNSMESSVNSRINSLENSVNSRFNSVDSRFNSVDARFDRLEAKFDTLTGVVVDLDNRVTRIEAKLGIN